VQAQGMYFDGEHTLYLMNKYNNNNNNNNNNNKYRAKKKQKRS
jgi:hypothetical protein